MELRRDDVHVCWRFVWSELVGSIGAGARESVARMQWLYEVGRGVGVAKVRRLLDGEMKLHANVYMEGWQL